MFLAEALGKTNNEFSIKSPTHEIARVTTTAIAVVNNVWIALDGIPREDASCGCIAVNVSLFAKRIQKIITQTNTIAKIPISPGVTDKISPIRYLLYLVKLLPSRVAIKIPSATAVLENTPISVSAV